MAPTARNVTPRTPAVDTNGSQHVVPDAKRPKDEAPANLLGIKPVYVFFILLALLVASFAVFFHRSYSALDKMFVQIEKDVTQDSWTSQLLESSQDKVTEENFQLHALVALERDVMQHRHQRASTLLATRTWMRFMSLVFGATLIIVGASFVLGQITAPHSTGNAEFQSVKLSFASSSPGLFLIVLGAILVGIPNLASQPIDVRDAPTYFTSSGVIEAPPVDERQQAIDEIVQKYGGTNGESAK